MAYILISQKKNDEALAEYDKALELKKLTAYWESRMMYRKADFLKKIKKNDEAIKLYKQIIAIKGGAGWAKAGSKKSIKALEAK